ncbi:serine endopeptidase [Colletotrichum truncatum]|uniref:Serine endopeptidase n=1 Tax=Colletotrichum truncatum TaxID=5467 RepID=A0ACC3YYC5_COLTU|nr:serine endopeptidase [Colletotrichum truncatum]KAF6782070.1 serine endopeptidase [Colletotrichum truncatum]
MQLFIFALLAQFTIGVMGEKFIVEFGSSKDEDREELISKLTADGKTTIVKRFDHVILSGVVIETGNHNLDTLRMLPNVGNVWSSRNEGLLSQLSDSRS